MEIHLNTLLTLFNGFRYFLIEITVVLFTQDATLQTSKLTIKYIVISIDLEINKKLFL